MITMQLSDKEHLAAWCSMGHYYSNPMVQYMYCRSPMYCRMDVTLLDLAGWSFWDDLDGCIDAPECYPVGSVFNRDKYALGFVYRGYDVVEHARAVELATRLIDSILNDRATTVDK